MQLVRFWVYLRQFLECSAVCTLVVFGIVVRLAMGKWIYLGKNRFFGFECRRCDCCKFQYFLIVAVNGLIVLIICIASYLIFDQFVATDTTKEDTTNINPIKTDENGDVNVNETRLFSLIELVAGCVGLGLFVSGIVVYYCCINRKSERDHAGAKSPSIHANDHEYQE